MILLETFEYNKLIGYVPPFQTLVKTKLCHFGNIHPPSIPPEPLAAHQLEC